ncbi:MAG TPA: hypothetical protein VGB82_12465 [Alphaproteobacteria bacterium]
MTRIPLRLITGLILAIVLDTAVQLTWKVAAARIPSTFDLSATALAAVHDPIFIAVAVLIAAQLINWLRVLDLADLSYAQPITALSYLSVCFLSAKYFGETLEVGQLVGLGLIFAGVWLVSRTDHATPSAKIVAP